VNVVSYDFGNGMVHNNLDNSRDLINYPHGACLGSNGGCAEGGRDGLGDGYFALGSADGIWPHTLEFAFSEGVTQFGFFGAEACCDPAREDDGIMHLDFYDIDNMFIQSMSVNTNGIYRWDQFHDFKTDGANIGRVVLNNAGYFVMDDIYFTKAVIPIPPALWLFGTGMLGLIGIARKKAA